MDISPKARLTQPLIRENGSHRPATWEEAFARITQGFRTVIEEQGPRLCTIGSHGPDIRLSVPIGDECNPAAISREPRMVIQGDAAVLRQALCAPSCGAHPVYLSQQIKDYARASGAHIDRHERSLARVEIDRPWISVRRDARCMRGAVGSAQAD